MTMSLTSAKLMGGGGVMGGGERLAVILNDHDFHFNNADLKVLLSK